MIRSVESGTAFRKIKYRRPLGRFFQKTDEKLQKNALYNFKLLFLPFNIGFSMFNVENHICHKILIEIDLKNVKIGPLSHE